MRPYLVLFVVLLPALFAQEVPPPFEDRPPEPAAEDPFDPDQSAPHVIQVQVEWIDLPHENLTELLLQHSPGTANATGLRMKVQHLVKAGTAKVLETQLLVARSGEKALTESIAEFIYPTEYVDPEAIRRVKEDGKVVEIRNENKGSVVPTSFETRNLGSTLEIEPTLDESGKIIDLRFAPDLSWQTGRTLWQERKDEFGSVIRVEMPEIYTIRTTTSLALRGGVYSLAAVLSPKDQNGRTDLTRKVMMFVKADRLAVR